MDIQKLRALVDVSHTRSYTETAERLYTTQATISKHILAVEKELGVQVFRRVHRTVEPTQIGMKVIDNAQLIVDQYDQLLRDIGRDQQRFANELVIKTIPSVVNYRGFKLIRSFNAQFEDVKLRLSEAESYELLRELRDGEADVIFARVFALEQPDFDMLVEETDQFVAVLPKSHPLADRKSVAVTDLTAEPLLILGHETNLYAPVMDMFQQANIQPIITYEGQRIDLILQMIEGGMGISIMMDKSVQLATASQLVKIPIKTDLHSQLAFMRNRGAGKPAITKFWQFLERQSSKNH